MRYQNVCLEALGYAVPSETVTSAEIEARLAPLYTRLRLPEGRLELMTGIRERRFWPVGTLPSEMSVVSAALALRAAELDAREVGALVHGSVCRDFLEPATACGVHHRLALPSDCFVYDVSNACLGILNGILQVANLIELGAIRAGLVVGSEGSRQLVETTIDSLNRDPSLTRDSIKRAMASLTIGSASAAALLVDRRLSRTGNRLASATVCANTAFHDLCQSGRDEAVAGEMRPLMQTDAERLMLEGVATGAATFDAFLAESGWTRDSIGRTVCHQVGAAHRKLMLKELGLSPERDSTTVATLGNTGSAALPITLALAAERGEIEAGDQVALLGIGSGINCIMLALECRSVPLVAGSNPAATNTQSLAPPHFVGGAAGASARGADESARRAID